MALEDQIIGAESGGDPSATNPNSSATGLGQFTRETWLNTIRAHRPDLLQQYSPQELLAMRTDPALSREMTRSLAEDNANYLRQRGLDSTPGNVYLAHFAGAKGAAGILSADDTAPVSQVLSPDAITANPFLAKMTVGDLKAWASNKMGGPAPSSSAKAAPAAAPPTDADLALAQPGSELAQAYGGGAQQPVSPSTFPSATLEQIPQLLAAMQKNDQPTPVEPPQKIEFPTPPGIARTRALLRAMAQRPIG